MKKIYAIIAVVLINASAFAQAPEKMSYQAVVRDASNNLVTSTGVGMQISILQGSAGGTAVYVETQTPGTNTNGLISIEIGSGTVVTGDFTTIDWANGPYFIKTETDPAGGTNYTITGTSQLLSVPYALHAKTAESITGIITETDPVFGASTASDITTADTANWNNHTVDTDTQLDSTGVANLGFVAGAHTVNTDTQLDSTGVAALGFAAGAHTVDTDTQLDSSGIAALGFAAGAHTVDTDTQLDSTDIANLGYIAGAMSETDPVFATSVAGGITGADTTNWNNKLDTEIDADSTNELQNFSTSGDTLFLSNSNYVIIPGLYAANFTCGDSVQDVDGNWYDIVQIGLQCWLKENMRTTKYPGGGAITKGPVPAGSGWTADLSYYSCPPNVANTAEDCAAAASLGLVYQWSAAMDGSTTAGAQGVCPTGWHIPTDEEWKTLEGQLGMTVTEQNNTGWRGTNEGSEMANDVADQTWIVNTLTGGAGFGDANGLNVGPSGYRTTAGNYLNRSYEMHLWSSTESGTNAWRRHLFFTMTQVLRSTSTKAIGFSVRCVQD